ncbi:MAG: hypothetical protein IPM02_22390 [Betaproteobacteria bacterium]|nr:hypothetical protein [Betaproteobacteria bacterium]
MMAASRCTDRRAIWFWQDIVSPHMAGLAVALTHQNCDVTYVAEERMSEDRARQGWVAPRLPAVQLKVASCESEVDRLVASAPSESIHICQGIRGNGLIGRAQSGLFLCSLDG